LKLIPTIKDKTIAVLGLAFKANTDDVRDSSAIKTIQSLLDHQVHIKAYDPEATKNMRVLFPDITYCTSLYEAVTGADAAIIMTEWDEFKCMDLVQVKSLMRQHYIIDARNILSPAQLQELGFIAESIGRSCLYCKAA
jgi:UDPglucose 6-dehydrogenase